MLLHSASPPATASKVRVRGLDDDTVSLINRLFVKLAGHSAANLRRAAAYDQTAQVRALGLHRTNNAQVANAVTALGWVTKSVHSLSDLIRNDGPVVPASAPGSDEFGILSWWAANRLAIEGNQVQTDAVIHGLAFLVTTRGDISRGEPEIVTTMQTALSATGDWNPRTRRLDNFLSLTGPDEFVLYVPGTALVCTRAAGDAEYEFHPVPMPLPYVPVDVLPLRPRIGRPLGSSRITPAMMSLQSSAVRTILRSELGAESYIDPVRALLGSDMRIFQNPDGTPNAAAQSISTGKTILVPPVYTSPEGEELSTPLVAKLETIPGADMTPHRDHMEMFASLFAVEANIPITELGVRGNSQPVSAEALAASRSALILEAEDAISTFSLAFTGAAQTSWRLRNPGQVLPPDLLGLSFKYRDPNAVSLAARADAMVKLVQAGIVPAESPVVLETLGWGTADIARIEADRRRYGGLRALDRLSGDGS